MKNLYRLMILFFFLFLLGACTAGPNALRGIPDTSGEIAGFWLGLWQGFISPFVFIVSLFHKGLTVYETHNNGNWYNLGFLLGCSAIFGGSGRGACRKRRK